MKIDGVRLIPFKEIMIAQYGILFQQNGEIIMFILKWKKKKSKLKKVSLSSKISENSEISEK